MNSKHIHYFNTLSQHATGILGSEAIKWNFTKFLIAKDGRVLKRYASVTKPEDIQQDIEQALSA